MKDFKNATMLFTALLIGAASFVSCGGSSEDDAVDPPFNNNENNDGNNKKPDTTVSNECYTEPSNILLMSDGLAFNWKYGNDTQYFYWNFFTQEEYNKLSESEVRKKVATGNEEDRITPSHDDFACVYNCSEAKQYVIVTVSFSKGDKQGEMVVTPMTTKTSNNQPRANIGEVKYYTDSNSNLNYGWETTKNKYCKQYYTYAAAAPDYFYSYHLLNEGYTPMLAWLLRNEITKNGEDHTTSINTTGTLEFTGGRDKFFGAQVEGGMTYLRAFRNVDKYFLVVTWSTGANDELSGVLCYSGFELNISSAPKKTLKNENATLRGSQKLNFNKNDFHLIRID